MVDELGRSKGERPVLLVTQRPASEPPIGRGSLWRIHRDVFASLFGPRLVSWELGPSKSGALRSAWEALWGRMDGLTPGTVRAIVRTVATDRPRLVFLDGSNFGEVARAIRHENPEVPVFTFFHNVEARFFWGAFRHRPRPRSLAVLVVNYLAERKAVRHSQRRLVMTERDSRLLERVYGRPATDVVPMAVPDPGPAKVAMAARPGPPYLLFVGGGFYANRHAVEWFVRHVAPQVQTRCCFVGQGLEELRSTLPRLPNVEIVGGVDDLAPWYQGCRFVVAPIFDGSGMKTKIAEALAFGKTIVGTPEAFIGYEEVAARAGRVCRSGPEFVAAIRGFEASPPPAFDPALRALFERHYSIGAARARLAAVLGV